MTLSKYGAVPSNPQLYARHWLLRNLTHAQTNIVVKGTKQTYAKWPGHSVCTTILQAVYVSLIDNRVCCYVVSDSPSKDCYTIDIIFEEGISASNVIFKHGHSTSHFRTYYFDT